MPELTEQLRDTEQHAQRQLLRRRHRAARRALSPREQLTASHALAKRVTRSAAFRHSKSIACYIASDGEIDLGPIIDSAWRRGKHVVLPQLVGDRHMEFRRYRRGDRLRRGRWGLREPCNSGGTVPAWTIELILLPLVAFDSAGNRLGRGGGFYDRILQGAGHATRLRQHPRLLGVAHQCQQAERIPAAPWDTKLHAVATDTQWLAFD